MKTSYRVGIRTCSDNSPYGVELDGRTVSGYGYRFGYQGSEKDNELKGDGNSYSTEFRQLDPRLGRWLSLDPVIQPWQSTFCSMNNNPVSYNDQDGQEVGGKRGRERRKKERKLDRQAKQLSREEKKLAKSFARKNDGKVKKTEDDNGNIRYLVAHTNNDDESNLTSFGSTSQKWNTLNKSINDKKDALYGREFQAGELVGVQISISNSFFCVAGMSYSYDISMSENSFVIGNTVGGGFGLEAGVSMDIQYVFAEKRGPYTAENIQKGKGFAFSIEAGAFNYSRSGNQDESGHKFGWFGNQLTGNGASVSALPPGNALNLTKFNEVVKMLSKSLGRTIKVKGGVSYQWTQGYIHKSF